jgi:phage tail sheath protein FI
MATNVLLSPGVLARENDTSFINQRPPAIGAAIIGPTVKGPIGVPTMVTTYSDFAATFGDLLISGGAPYSYMTSIAAYNYFQNGGETLMITRVVSNSSEWAPANASVSSSTQATNQPAFVLETLSEGVIMNSAGAQDSKGGLVSGSVNNLRWEIVSPNTSSGTFTLLIRRGDDNTNSPIILEQWTQISLDPLAPNYIEAAIGNYEYVYDSVNNQLNINGDYANRSRYVRVKSVNNPTPNYLNSAGQIAVSSYTASLPIAQTGAFANATGDIIAGVNFYNDITATNTQGLTAGSYTDAIALMSNDDYKFNALYTPGLIYEFTGHGSKIDTIIQNTQNRGDNIYVLDLLDYGGTVNGATAQANNLDTSYAATYWPWVSTRDVTTGRTVWVPASAFIPGVYAFNDSVAEPWFAPAGINRGGLTRVIRAEYKLSAAQRDALYLSNVNPLASFPGTGTAVYGQKTLQRKPSALDRVNVRRLLIVLKSYISRIATSLVFEQNTQTTRNIFLAQVIPYLESVQQRQGLYAFKVVMDNSNNSSEAIDRNELIGQIYLQPTKTAEFIYLDFNITPTGATFPA